LCHSHRRRADAVFNFEYQPQSWAAPATGLDRRQSFVPDCPLDRPRPQRKVKRRGEVAMSVATSSISVAGGPVGPPAEPGPAAPAIASLPASPDHTTSPCTCVMSRRRADPGQRLPAAGAAGSQPSTRRNEPRHGRSLSLAAGPSPLAATASPHDDHLALPRTPATAGSSG
jgi:hypothetical protein